MEKEKEGGGGTLEDEGTSANIHSRYSATFCQARCEHITVMTMMSENNEHLQMLTKVPSTSPSDSLQTHLLKMNGFYIKPLDDLE